MTDCVISVFSTSFFDVKERTEYSDYQLCSTFENMVTVFNVWNVWHLGRNVLWRILNEYLGGLRSQCFLLLISDVHVCRPQQVIAESDPEVPRETDRDFGEVKRVDFLCGDRAREWGVRPVGEGAMDKVDGNSKAHLQKKFGLKLWPQTRVVTILN